MGNARCRPICQQGVQLQGGRRGVAGFAGAGVSHIGPQGAKAGGFMAAMLGQLPVKPCHRCFAVGAGYRHHVRGLAGGLRRRPMGQQLPRHGVHQHPQAQGFF